MIDGLIAGKVYGQPVQRTAKTGKPFAVAKVRVSAGDGEGVFVSVIAFDAAPCAALLALGEGDAVSMAGTLTPKVWTDKASSLSLTKKANLSLGRSRGGWMLSIRCHADAATSCLIRCH